MNTNRWSFRSKFEPTVDLLKIQDPDEDDCQGDTVNSGDIFGIAKNSDLQNPTFSTLLSTAPLFTSPERRAITKINYYNAQYAQEVSIDDELEENSSNLAEKIVFEKGVLHGEFKPDGYATDFVINPNNNEENETVLFAKAQYNAYLKRLGCFEENQELTSGLLSGPSVRNYQNIIALDLMKAAITTAVFSELTPQSLVAHDHTDWSYGKGLDQFRKITNKFQHPLVDLDLKAAENSRIDLVINQTLQEPEIIIDSWMNYSAEARTVTVNSPIVAWPKLGQLLFKATAKARWS